MKYFLASFSLFFVGLTLTGQNSTILFKRIDEPREKALSLLIPGGWTIDGGAIRIMDPNIAGANNMVECKFDLTVKKDISGSVLIRWLPEMLCIDQSMAWGNPEGAVFNNTLVRQKRSPEKFIIEVAVPYAHPEASDLKIVSGKSLPGMAEQYQKSLDPMVAGFTNMSYQAYLMEFSYLENGRYYQERMVTVIENYGVNGGGLWKNRGTMLIRAPAGELAKWEPILSVIQNSGKWNMSWITAEINGQRQRSGQILATQQELQAIDNAIAENRRNTYSEINKDMFLTITGQDEYKNPITGKLEIDTNNWNKRWVNSNGDIIYSNDSNYNPNYDPDIKISGFELSQPRK